MEQFIAAKQMFGFFTWTLNFSISHKKLPTKNVNTDIENIPWVSFLPL